MISKFKFWIILLLFFSGSIFVSNATALKFTGDAWLAQHYVGDAATDEYYLVIKNSGINLESIRLKGIAFEPSTEEPDFFLLTNQQSNENVTWLKINTEKSHLFRKLERKAERKSNNLLRRGVLTNEEARQEWMDEWINNSLEELIFNLRFRDENGNRYKGKIGFATFENPVEYPTKDNGVAPVPEPATMLLLGTGLVGLAGFSRKKFFRS